MNNDTPRHDRVGLQAVGDLRVPDWPQLGFIAPFGALVVLLAVLNSGEIVNHSFLLGVILAVTATAAAFIVPWDRYPTDVMMVLPLLDLAAVGAMRLTPGVSVSATLAVLPAMWMGLVYRRRGVVVITAASVLLMTVPALLYFGWNIDGWSRALVHPLVVFATAAIMALTAQAWSAQRTDLEDQGRLLADALAEVRSQQRINEVIVSTVDVGLLTLAPDGTYLSTNPQLDQFLAIAFPDGHRGTAGQLGAVYAADNRTVLTHDEMPSVRAANGETFTGQTIWIGERNARRSHSVSSRPMFAEDGTFEGAILAYHDVTDLMQAVQVKDDFVASVSHELRTPLTSIIGYLDLVTEYNEELPEKITHYLSVASRNADRLLLLVSDLLTAAKVESGPMRLTLRATDLREVVRSGLANIAQRAVDAGVMLHESLAPVTLRSADPDRLAQVVDNLLSNAVKYTAAGGTVDVALEQTSDAVLLTIRDTGIGISADEKAHLFTKFFRARGAEERAIPGVGLGLVIAKSIVEAHGGALEVESIEGVGTTMRMRLPATSAGASTAPVVP